jgi:hypothetical protein
LDASTYEKTRRSNISSKLQSFLRLVFASDGSDLRRHHLLPDFTVASTKSSRSSNS